MSERDAKRLFLGDATDPWVAAIAGAMPEGTVRLSPGDEMPEVEDAAVIVVHRPVLCSRDGEALAFIKGRKPTAPKVILCLGPHVRAREIERWGISADVILHEATAPETIGRHVAPKPRPRGPRPSVDVIGGTFESRRVTLAMCEAAGYPAKACRDWDDRPGDGPAVWEVPVLEPGWERAMRDQAGRGPVVALLGFADRETVRLARDNGASACLDFPCDPEDLAIAPDRATSRPIADPAHAVPPPMKAKKHVRLWTGQS